MVPLVSEIALALDLDMNPGLHVYAPDQVRIVLEVTIGKSVKPGELSRASGTQDPNPGFRSTVR